MITIKIDKAEQCSDDYSMFISFPYNTEIIDVIHALPKRAWIKDTKEWEVPIKQMNSLLEKFSKYEIQILATDMEWAKEKKVEIPNDFSFKTQPFAHQIDGFKYGLANNKWLLGDEQGLGKTKQVIDIAVAKKLANGYQHCLIVCGVNGLKWNWYNEVHTHSNETAHILGQKANGTIGGNQDKLNDLVNIADIHDYFIITNVESFRNEEIVKRLNVLCKTKVIGMICLDECHKCFDYDTLVTTDIGQIKIGDIVSKKMSVNVMSYNESTGQQEYKPVVNWFRNHVETNLLELEIETANGVKTIRCTPTHKFLTSNRGWVCAENLTEDDDIIELDTFCLM